MSMPKCFSLLTRTFGLLFLTLTMMLASVAVLAQDKDEAATPRTNFYAWANSEWLANTPLPPDKPMVDNFSAIDDTINNQIKTLLSELRSSSSQTDDQKKLLGLYDAYLDWNERNKRGIQPIDGQMKAIEAIQTHEDVAKTFAEFQWMGIESPLMPGTETDFKNSKIKIAYFSQAGLGIDRDYYLGKDPQSEKQRKLYEALITKLMSLASLDDPEGKTKDVMALETKLAAIQWSKVQNRQLEKLYNIYTIPDYLKLTEPLYSNEMIEILKMPTESKVSVMQVPYVEQYTKLFREISVDSWKNYLRVRLLDRYKTLLSQDFKKAAVDYEIGKGLYTEEKPMWHQAQDYLSSNVGFLLSKEYVQKYFDETEKKEITDLVLSIRDGYRDAITNAKWLSEPTRKKALEKLEKMRFQIGYPEKWRDYSSLKVDAHDLIGNDMRIARYEHERDMKKVGAPVDDSDWGHPPIMVNAYYSPASNTFVLLAGILLEPFFEPGASKAKNYGGIGFAVGHEIGHGFDDQGSTFDGDGNMNNWWTEADRAAFNKFKQQLIDQANHYEIMPGTFLKGELEIGEIIGDLSGSQIALAAFKKVSGLDNKSNPDADKEFFTQLARTWRSKMRPEVTKILLQINPHPPSEFRGNGIVKQFNEFYEAFHVVQGDKMYLPPDQRVLLW